MAVGMPKGISFGHSSTGIPPLRRSAGALPIACDAFNARTVAVREYHYPSRASAPASRHACFTVQVLIARPLQWSHPVDLNRGLGAPPARLGTIGTYPSALFCAGIIRRAFFVNRQLQGGEREDTPRRKWHYTGKI